MKKIYNLITIVLVANLIVFFFSCDAKNDIIDNMIYLSEAENNSSLKLILDDKEGGKGTIAVRAGSVVDADIQVTVDADIQALDEYNKKNGTQYVMYPKELYSLSSTSAIIPKGKVGADVIDLDIKPLTKELQETGDSYAIPIAIKSVSGGISSLKSASNFIYILDQVIITSVPIINRRNNIKMNMRQNYALDTWTVEFRVNMDMLGTGVGQLNNQTLFYAFAPEGTNNVDIYTRFGDAPIPGNVFQAKLQGTQFNSNTSFKIDTWYHLAIVNEGPVVKFYVNGQLDVAMDSPGHVTNLAKDKFAFGNTDYLKANVMVSEMRFWTKAITQKQIQNNMFIVNPKSEGLEAYWKLNEGSGNVFKDATGNGNDAVSTGKTYWVDGIRSDGK